MGAVGTAELGLVGWMRAQSQRDDMLVAGDVNHRKAAFEIAMSHGVTACYSTLPHAVPCGTLGLLSPANR